MEKKYSKGLKINHEIEKLIDEIVFDMITYKVPCVSSNLAQIYGFELTIRVENIEASLEVDSRFADKMGIKLLDLGEIIRKVNPDYKSKKVYFNVERMIDLNLPGFNLYNESTVH